MRIAKTLLIGPDDNDWYAVPALAASFFVFAYSTRFGQLPILVYYALWLPLVLVDYRRVLGNYARYHWILAFPAVACLSVFWSHAPGVTARASMQYVTHVACALIAARTVSARTLALGGLCGVGLVLAFSFAFGSYSFDPFDQDWGFVGAFASKNQFGFFASLGVFFSYGLIAVFRERLMVRIFAAAAGALSAYGLVVSSSATSVISIVAALAAMSAIGVLFRFSPRHRRTIFLLMAVVVPVVVALAVAGGAVDALLGAFGKSTTLTGRTYLWQQGLETAKASPLVGVGYQAFWVVGSSEAERLWAEFQIVTKTGFHFHDTYIEALVELGMVGATLLAVAMAGTIVGHLRRLLVDERNASARLLCGLGILFLVRSFVEVDILNAYQVGSFLFYYAAARAVIPHPQPQFAARCGADVPAYQTRPAAAGVGSGS